jgi:hypothetical protein
MDVQESKVIMMAVIQQAIRDYVTYYEADKIKEMEIWETARLFLFDEKYYFVWGDDEITPEEFMDILDLDIEYIRDLVKIKIKTVRV